MVEASSSYDQCSTGWTAMIIVMMVMVIVMIAMMMVMVIVMMAVIIVMMAMIIVMIAMMVMIMAKDGGNHLQLLCRFDDDDDGT